MAGLFFFTLALAALPVSAQSGCTGDPCLFYTPTPTTTPTPINTPGPGTPTPVAMPSPQDFPRPFYNRPTSIPNINFPTVPDALDVDLPQPDPWPTPSPFDMPDVPNPDPIDLPLTGTTAISLEAINSSISLSYTTPLALNQGGLTGTAAYTAVTGIIGTGREWVSDTVSYTLWLSGEAAAINPTETFTVATAPDWYAPPLPRPMANVGWTFETIQDGIDSGVKYSLPTWAGFFGYIVSLPFQFIKMLLGLADFLGPLGLFIIWLLIMLPFVTFVRIWVFIKNLFISLFNLIHKFIRFIGDIWDLIPGL